MSLDKSEDYNNEQNAIMNGIYLKKRHQSDLTKMDNKVNGNGHAIALLAVSTLILSPGVNAMSTPVSLESIESNVNITSFTSDSDIVLDFSKYFSEFNIKSIFEEAFTSAKLEATTLNHMPYSLEDKTYYEYGKNLGGLVRSLLIDLNALNVQNYQYRKSIDIISIVISELDKINAKLSPGLHEMLASSFSSVEKRRLLDFKSSYGLVDMSSSQYFNQLGEWHKFQQTPGQDSAEVFVYGDNTLQAQEQSWRGAIVEAETLFSSMILNVGLHNDLDILGYLFVAEYQTTIANVIGRNIQETYNSGYDGRYRSRIHWQRIKTHFSNLLYEELQNLDIYRSLKGRSDVKEYSDPRTIFEAQTIAVEIVQEKFGGQSPAMDHNDKIVAFHMMLSSDDVSDEVKSYLLKASSLAYAMMTNKASLDTYARWQPKMLSVFMARSSSSLYANRLLADYPANYAGMETFRRSDDTDSWSEYYNQFVDYKKDAIDFDARSLSYRTLLGFGLTDYDISLMQPESIKYGKLSIVTITSASEMLTSGRDRNPSRYNDDMIDGDIVVSGIVAFISMTDGRMLAISGLNMQLNAKIFSKHEVRSIDTLDQIRTFKVQLEDATEAQVLPFEGVHPQFEGKALRDAVLIPLLGSAATDILLEDHFAFPIMSGPGPDQVGRNLYDVDPHPVGDKAMIEVVDEASREILKQWTSHLKGAYRDSDFGSFVLSLIPLYDELNKGINDPEHIININSITLDVVGIVTCVGTAVGGIAKLSHAAKISLERAIATGLSHRLTGKALMTSTLKILMRDPEFTRLGLKGMQLAIVAIVDGVFPVSPKVVILPMIRNLKNLRKQITASKLFYKRQPVNSAWTRADKEFNTLKSSASVMIRDDLSLTVRNSRLQPGAVIAEQQALSLALGHRQPIRMRAGDEAPHAYIDPCFARLDSAESGLIMCLPITQGVVDASVHDMRVDDSGVIIPRQGGDPLALIPIVTQGDISSGLDRLSYVWLPQHDLAALGNLAQVVNQWAHNTPPSRDMVLELFHMFSDYAPLIQEQIVSYSRNDRKAIVQTIVDTVRLLGISESDVEQITQQLGGIPE